MRKNLDKKLNLYILKLISTTYRVGQKQLIHVSSPENIDIDFLALYSRKNEYLKTKNTAICFYEDDCKFDNKNCLWDAIRYEDLKLLKKYKEKFKDTKIFIAPDYSLLYECSESFNILNIQRSRIVLLWLVQECDKIVIPNIMFFDENSLEYIFDGLEECKVVAISTKGSLKNNNDKQLFKLAIQKLVVKLGQLKKIIVYDVSINNIETMKLFEPAINKGIEIVIPDNTLKNRNRILRGEINGKN